MTGGLPRGAVPKGLPRGAGAGVSWVAGGGETKNWENKNHGVFGSTGVAVKRRGGVNSPFSLHHRCVGRVGPLTMTKVRRGRHMCPPRRIGGGME